MIVRGRPTPNLDNIPGPEEPRKRVHSECPTVHDGLRIQAGLRIRRNDPQESTKPLTGENIHRHSLRRGEEGQGALESYIEELSFHPLKGKDTIGAMMPVSTPSFRVRPCTRSGASARNWRETG